MKEHDADGDLLADETYGYDQYGNETLCRDSGDTVSKTTYDEMSTTDSIGKTTQNTYDGFGRLIKTQTSEGSISTTSESACNGTEPDLLTLTLTDEAGNQTHTIQNPELTAGGSYKAGVDTILTSQAI